MPNESIDTLLGSFSIKLPGAAELLKHFTAVFPLHVRFKEAFEFSPSWLHNMSLKAPGFMTLITDLTTSDSETF